MQFLQMLPFWLHEGVCNGPLQDPAALASGMTSAGKKQFSVLRRQVQQSGEKRKVIVL